VFFHRTERRRKIVVLGALHRQYASPRVNYCSVVDPYEELARPICLREGDRKRGINEDVGIKLTIIARAFHRA
jgi:hypothetical protein